MSITGLGMGMDCMAMQSSYDADRVISLIQEYYELGKNPNDFEEEIYFEVNVNPDDLFWYDKDRINEVLEELNNA